MLVIRPATPADVGPLVDLAGLASFGLTTLPRDADFLRRRIRDSERGFGRIVDAEPRGESYLFVMEETRTGRVVGTAAVVSKVGGFEPFYAYRIEAERHESATLGVRREIPVLQLVREHDGRVGDERPSQRDSLLLATRELYRSMVVPMSQTDLLEGGQCFLPSLDRFYRSIQEGGLHVRNGIEMGNQVELLEDETDAPTPHTSSSGIGEAGDFFTVDFDGSFRWHVETTEQTEHRRFTGTGRPDDRNEVPRHDP